jgi:hypothetical protein
MSRAIALETPRGFRIAKEKTSHKIDVVVALAMAALACVERGDRERALSGPGVLVVGGSLTGVPRLPGDMAHGPSAVWASIMAGERQREREEAEKQRRMWGG